MGLVVFRGLVRIEEGPPLGRMCLPGPPRGFIVYTPLPRASPPRGLGAVEVAERTAAGLTSVQPRDTVRSLAAVANVVIGVVQGYSAKRTLDCIALLHQDDAIVPRDGDRVPVRGADIVQDDVVVLRGGDQVPVDGEALTAEGLDREEALLTGENDPVPTHAGDAVLSGSAVVAGTGVVLAIVVAVRLSR